MLINFPDVDRFIAQSSRTLNPTPAQYTLFTRVFGATDTEELRKRVEKSRMDLLGPVERAFLNDSAATAALEKADIANTAALLVTFSSDTRYMKRWELSARIRLVTADSPDQPGNVEADLQSLVRDFGACISIPLLYGQDFLDRYPQLLDDFWKFDNDLFPLLMVGIPSWAPIQMMKEGLAARSRLADAMAALYRRIGQYQRGEQVDFGADMSDISDVALGRHQVYEKENWPIRHRADLDLAILWGQNANTQPVLFWLLAFIYSTPGLLESVREEAAQYVRISRPYPPRITFMDITGLSSDCPLLKACVFETYRLTVEATSIRYVEKRVSVDAGMYQQELKPGMFVSIPHAVTQRDTQVYANPDEFNPSRFLEVDKASGRPAARYGRLKPWGSGPAMCKGRTFAEKELISCCAAIISLWDISPASGSWNLPAMVPGTGVKKPVADIRVSIQRRAFS